jgi:hypothetical protein
MVLGYIKKMLCANAFKFTLRCSGTIRTLRFLRLLANLKSFAYCLCSKLHHCSKLHQKNMGPLLNRGPMK